MKIPSPCINVCKYKYKSHCIGCSMTRVQKKLFKKLTSSEKKIEFIKLIIIQQIYIGRFKHWKNIYEKKCSKKGTSLKNLLSQMGIK